MGSMTSPFYVRQLFSLIVFDGTMVAVTSTTYLPIKGIPARRRKSHRDWMKDS